MTVLIIFWIGFCLLAAILLLKKKNYLKTTYSELVKMDPKQSYNKDVDITGVVMGAKSLQLPTPPRLFMTQIGTSLENIIIDDGTGKFKIIRTSTFKNWIKPGDKINVRGRYSGEGIVNAFEIYNFTTGKKEGKAFFLLMMFGGIAMGIIGLFLIDFSITIIDIVIFLIFFASLVSFAIYWTKNIANKKLGISM